MNKNFVTSLKNRRSIYQLSSEAPISDEQIIQIVEECTKHTPSAFNSQTSRVVVLLGMHHRRLWDIVEETLRAVVPPENFASTEQKIASFRAAYGSLLFLEDQSTVQELQKQFPAYQENFPIWSQQASGMLQSNIWVALENEGFGASLQHYNPLIDEAVVKEWALSSSWKLVAQMPFGKPTAQPDPKEFMPIEERVKIFK